MMKWIIEGSRLQAMPGCAEPQFVSEPFLTEEGARHFAMMLTERGYVVAARAPDEEGEVVTVAGDALVTWMNSE